jgi:hypothetical protein
MHPDPHRCRLNAQRAGRLGGVEAEPLDKHQGLALPERQCTQHAGHLGARLDHLGRIRPPTRRRPHRGWP